MKYTIGVDGGNNGAIVVLDKNDSIVKWTKMPIMRTTDSRNEYDCGAIVRFLSNFKPSETIIVLEKAHAMPKLGTVQAFNFGKSFGQMIGIIISLGYSHHIVHAKTWQTKMFRDQPHDDTKKASEIVAKRLFPTQDFVATDRSSKVHDGFTDATLIAYYGKHYIS